jgi:hypothetical protein
VLRREVLGNMLDVLTYRPDPYMLHQVLATGLVHAWWISVRKLDQIEASAMKRLIE